MQDTNTWVIISAFLAAGLFGSLFLLLYWRRRSRNSEKEKQDLETRFRELETRVNTLQLETLDARLNPHLFKNVLNSIQSHAFQTYFALDKLAHVLDYILYESKNGFVSPSEEIGFALNFIEINKIKVSPLFQLNVKTRLRENDPLLAQKVLAPMVSVDLIENAFKHADLQSADAFISVVFECRDNQFQLTVSNKISGKPVFRKEKSGIGSNALEQRLRILYRDKYSLQRYTEGDVYIAQLKINLLDYLEMPVTG
ncbi:MAG: histidine kinase [Bacteroidia bacterium]|nr:histidine kinase [Bacteroidia bacterium]